MVDTPSSTSRRRDQVVFTTVIFHLCGRWLAGFEEVTAEEPATGSQMHFRSLNEASLDKYQPVTSQVDNMEVKSPVLENKGQSTARHQPVGSRGSSF